jgi:hypothetical protein
MLIADVLRVHGCYLMDTMVLLQGGEIEQHVNHPSIKRQRIASPDEINAEL